MHNRLGTAALDTSLARKRLFVLRSFLGLTILNNALLAAYCLGFGGGEALAAVPQRATAALGLLGVVTVVCALGALAWRRWGVVGIVTAGVAASGIAGAVHLLPAMLAFCFGTAFLVLIVRHHWARMR